MRVRQQLVPAAVLLSGLPLLVACVASPGGRGSGGDDLQSGGEAGPGRLYQVLVHADGGRGWVRSCAPAPDGAPAWTDGCTGWGPFDLPPAEVADVAAWPVNLADDPRVRFEALLAGGDRVVSRTCDVDRWRAVDLGSCSGWTDSARPRTPGGPFRAFGAYPFTHAGAARLLSSFVERLGSVSRASSCDVREDGGLEACSPWSGFDLTRLEVGAFERYGAYRVADDGGAHLRQSALVPGSTRSVMRSCPVHPDGRIDWSRCGGFTDGDWERGLRDGRACCGG